MRAARFVVVPAVAVVTRQEERDVSAAEVAHTPPRGKEEVAPAAAPSSLELEPPTEVDGGRS